LAQDDGRLRLVPSCRYRHDDFGAAVIPVARLSDDALFRLMGWLPGLRRLSYGTRAMLVQRLDGHPRAVEYANDLIEHALSQWEARHDRKWIAPASPTLVDSALEWGLIE